MYILHPLLVDAYDRYVSVAVTEMVGDKEPWLRPLIVLGFSLVAAVIWERVDSLLTRRNRK